MAVRRGKAAGKEASEESSARPAKAVQDSDKPKASSPAAWGKPPGAPPRTPPRTPQHMSSSSTNGLAKAKALSTKTSSNIAALAARNLGGFVPNKIFVGGVPIQSTEEQFKAYFERFGATSKVELHALRGFGYITYEQVQSVDDCLEKYEEHYLCRKWVEVKRSIPRELIEAYEREQKRLTAEFNAEGGETISESPSVKVETPSNSASSAPTWGMPPARGPAVGLPGPGTRWGAPPSAAAKAPQEPGGSASTSQIQELTAMGFPEELARRVFRECAWDFNKALDRLLTSMVEEPPVDDTNNSQTVPSLADDPPLSAATATSVPQPSPSSPQARKEVTPTAWGKPAPAAGWAKPPETVWGAPKAATAWGKQASPAPPPSNKAPPGTPKASTPKAAIGSPKAAAEAMLLPPAASPPPAPSSNAASGAGRGGGYDSAAAASAPAESGGNTVATPASTPATPPSKMTPPSSSVPPPPAALPPAAATTSPLPPLEVPPPRTGAATSPGPASGQQFQSSSGSPKLKPEDLEPRVQPTNSQLLPPSSQPPPPEVNNSPMGEVDPVLPLTSKSDVLGAHETVMGTQEPIAVAIAANLVADDEEEVDNGAEPSPELAMTSESKGGPVDVTDGSAEGAPVATPPRKRIQRMKRDWVAEDPSQLSADDGNFVSVWVETGTDHGWIHAERLTGLTDGVSQIGWMPVCVLHELPNNQRWMRTKQAWQAMGESQSNVEADKLVIVWVDSRTAQGWTYVEASEDVKSQPGWLPDFCLEWIED